MAIPSEITEQRLPRKAFELPPIATYERGADPTSASGVGRRFIIAVRMKVVSVKVETGIYGRVSGLNHSV